MQIERATAVVTGAAAGLGAATARALHDRGARIAALDLHADPDDAGERWLPLAADVTSAASVDAAFARITDQWEAPSIVVHCAGVAGGFRLLGKEEPVAPERFEHVVRVNLLGTFHVVRAAAWQMSRRGAVDGERRVIVTTASIAAFEGQQGQLAYSASKAGVVGMLLPAARELAPLGVRCVAIAPGAFSTQLTTDLPPSLQEQLVESVAFPRRLGRAEEFADLVCAVVANQMINAEVIRIDAGARLASRS
jgi:NAD(P)-dependent dehydrogenase (short-subunit alcohol dehydrogenase family)